MKPYIKRINRASRIFPVILIILLQIMVQTSCVKEPLYDTEHPEHGKITLTTVWDDRGEDIDIPDSHTAHIGGYTSTLSGVKNAIDHLFPAGHHSIHIYNVADGITVSGTTATADYTTMPGWFFTGAHSVVIEKDKRHEITVPMRQQVRQLTLELEITGDAKDWVSSVEATLSGIVGSIDVVTGNPIGNPVTVALDFIRRDAINRVSTIRLLGIDGGAQSLSLTLHFVGGHTANYTVVSDLSRGLSGFNADKKTPLTLHSIFEITPQETGFTASIEPWLENAGSAIAEKER